MKNRTSNKTRFKEKRSEGDLAHHKPWIRVHEISSKGISWRAFSKKTKRVHHMLSTLELRVFEYLDRHPKVHDIKEQYKLDPDLTYGIAHDLEINHPAYQGEQVIMTTDFFVILESSQLAISVKPRNKMNNRTLEKFEIEQAYWKKRGIKWIVLTEEEIKEL